MRDQIFNMQYITITLLLFILIGLTAGCGTSDSTEIFLLTTNVSPAEGGFVTPSGGEFDEGSLVEIEAEPSNGFLFIRWEGDVGSTENPVSFEINSDMEVTAVFERMTHTLNIETIGEGSVDQEIIEAPKLTDFEHGTVVQLTAVPDESREFVRWEEDLDGDENPVTLTITEEKNVTAVFEWGIPFENTDCLSINPENLEIEPFGDRWHIVEGNSSLLLFDEFENAKKALDTIQFYEFTRWCFVGRPNPPMQYWLLDKAPPQIADDVPFQEDCIPVDPGNVEIEPFGDNWRIVDGNSALLVFEEFENAERGLDAIRFYGFTQICFVGRPNAPMQYWLR